MKRLGDGQWWFVLLPLLIGQVAMFALWVWGGWALGRAVAGPVAAPGLPGWVGAVGGALAWWGLGTGLDWLGYRVSFRVTRGRWQFAPLGGALAGWTLPVVVLGVPVALGGLCWGLVLALHSVL